MALFGQAAGSMFGGGGMAQGSAMMKRNPNTPWMQQQPGLGPSPQIQPQQQPEAPKNTMNREQWRDAWMGAGKMTPQQADQWLQSHGATQMQGGGKAGRWTTPHGEALDLQIARGAAMAGKRGGMITPGWTRMKGVRGGGQGQGMGQGGMEQMMGGNTGYGGGLGPSMDNRQGMPPGMGGNYGGGMPPWLQGMMGGQNGYSQMMGAGPQMSRTQSLMGGGQQAAQQMPQRSPWGQMNRMQP